MKAAHSNSISAIAFKTRCIEVIDQVAETGVPLTVTKRGKPFVKVLPARSSAKDFRPLCGRMRGSIKIIGDIVSPLPNEWETCQG